MMVSGSVPRRVVAAKVSTATFGPEMLSMGMGVEV